MNGLELAARFSLPTLREEKDKETFLEYIIHNNNEEDVKTKIISLPTVQGYFKIISEANGNLDCFDYKVVEAYWLGNQLTENVSADEIKSLIQNDFLKKAEGEKIRELECIASSLPEEVLVHHSFHVLFIGSLTPGFVNIKDIDSVNRCMVLYGTLTGKKEDKITVKHQRLKKDNGIYSLVNESREFNYDPRILSAGINERVAVHQGLVVCKIDEVQFHNLEMYTGINIQAINSLVL